MSVSEQRVREVWLTTDLSGVSQDECRECDQWIKRYALDKLATAIKDYPEHMRKYITICAKVHFGSIETDELLTALDCYPDWMTPRS